MAHDPMTHAYERARRPSCLPAVHRGLSRRRHRQSWPVRGRIESWLDVWRRRWHGCRRTISTRRLPHLRIAEERADIDCRRGSVRQAVPRRAGRRSSSAPAARASADRRWPSSAAGTFPAWPSEAQRKRPRTRFYDNLDGDTLKSALAIVRRSGHRALRRDLQVRRHARDAGAGAGRARGRQGGGAARRDSRAVPRRHRARGRGQGQRPAHPVRGARHSRCSIIIRASAGAFRR